MNAETTANKQQVVVLAADVNSYSIATVNLAVDIAAAVNTRLHGLFIEDEDLLQLSALPCTREVTLTTALERPASIERMRRSLRSLARQFERTLEQEAQASKIEWSFEYARGRIRDIGQKTGVDATCTVLGHVVSHRLPTRQAHGMRKILLCGQDSPYQQQALEVLLRRFSGDRVEITLVNDDQTGELAPWLMRRVAEIENRVTLFRIARDLLPDLLTKPGPRYDIAILSARESVESNALLLRTIDCTVILVA